MTFRFNWGWGIAVAYSAFAFGMLFLVYLCVRQKVELVRPDYYNQELAFQQRIDQKANTAALAERLEITYRCDAHTIRVQMPAQLAGTDAMQLRFYRPDDSMLDRTLTEPLTASNQITINTAGMKAGLWRLEMQWHHNGKDYYQETLLNL